MLSECAGAMRDVFDLLGCLGKRLVLIGITLKPGLELYQQHCEGKRPILLTSSDSALSVEAGW